MAASYPEFSIVKIDQTASAGVTVLLAAKASMAVRLHKLVVSPDTTGTITIEDTDGTDLTGPIPVAAGTPFVDPHTDWPRSVLITPTGKGMQINTSQKFYGYAIVSSKSN